MMTPEAGSLEDIEAASILMDLFMSEFGYFNLRKFLFCTFYLPFILTVTSCSSSSGKWPNLAFLFLLVC